MNQKFFLIDIIMMKKVERFLMIQIGVLTGVGLRRSRGTINL